MSTKRPPDFRIRIPLDLKEKIRKSSEQHNRSMGADIIARVEQTFKQENSRVTPDVTNSLLITAMYQTLREDGFTHDKAEQIIMNATRKLIDMDFIQKNLHNAVDNKG